MGCWGGNARDWGRAYILRRSPLSGPCGLGSRAGRSRARRIARSGASGGRIGLIWSILRFGCVDVSGGFQVKDDNLGWCVIGLRIG